MNIFFILLWKISDVLSNFMLDKVSHFKFRWNVTNVVFHLSFDFIFCWKKSLMKSIEKKISNSFKNENITFCFESKYASKYSFVLVFFKLIIIRNFSFFQIINVENETDDMIFNNIFCTLSFFVNEFNISFMTLRFLMNIEYEICFNFSTFDSFLKKMSILMSSLNFFKPDLNNSKWSIKIFWIFFLKSSFQWPLTSDFKASFKSIDSIKKKLTDLLKSTSEIVFSNNVLIESNSNSTLLNFFSKNTFACWKFANADEIEFEFRYKLSRSKNWFL